MESEISFFFSFEKKIDSIKKTEKGKFKSNAISKLKSDWNFFFFKYDWQSKLNAILIRTMNLNAMAINLSDLNNYQSVLIQIDQSTSKYGKLADQSRQTDCQLF